MSERNYSAEIVAAMQAGDVAQLAELAMHLAARVEAARVLEARTAARRSKNAERMASVRARARTCAHTPSPLPSLSSPTPLLNPSFPPPPKSVRPKAPKPERPASVALEALPAATVDVLAGRWGHRIGAVNYGRLRKALMPLYAACPKVYDGRQLAAALDAFADGMASDGPKWRGKWTPEKFAAELHEWVRLGGMELVDEWGAPTERGRLTGLFAA